MIHANAIISNSTGKGQDQDFQNLIDSGSMNTVHLDDFAISLKDVIHNMSMA